MLFHVIRQLNNFHPGKREAIEDIMKKDADVLKREAIERMPKKNDENVKTGKHT